MIPKYNNPEYKVKITNGQKLYAQGLRDINSPHTIKPQSEIYGKLGEIAICDILEIDRPKFLRADGGFDILISGVKCDVKTLVRFKEARKGDFFGHNWTHNVQARQINHDSEYYIFTTYYVPTDVLTICGYIHKDLFKAQATLLPQGTERTRADGSTFELYCDTYEIKQFELNPLNTEWDFMRIGT